MEQSEKELTGTNVKEIKFNEISRTTKIVDEIYQEVVVKSKVPDEKSMKIFFDLVQKECKKMKVTEMNQALQVAICVAFLIGRKEGGREAVMIMNKHGFG